MSKGVGGSAWRFGRPYQFLMFDGGVGWRFVRF